jgi:hypothetical protein
MRRRADEVEEAHSHARMQSVHIEDRDARSDVGDSTRRGADTEATPRRSSEGGAHHATNSIDAQSTTHSCEHDAKQRRSHSPAVRTSMEMHSGPRAPPSVDESQSAPPPLLGRAPSPMRSDGEARDYFRHMRAIDAQATRFAFALEEEGDAHARREEGQRPADARAGEPSDACRRAEATLMHMIDARRAARAKVIASLSAASASESEESRRSASTEQRAASSCEGAREYTPARRQVEEKENTILAHSIVLPRHCQWQ